MISVLNLIGLTVQSGTTAVQNNVVVAPAEVAPTVYNAFPTQNIQEFAPPVQKTIFEQLAQQGVSVTAPAVETVTPVASPAVEASPVAPTTPNDALMSLFGGRITQN